MRKFLLAAGALLALAMMPTGPAGAANLALVKPDTAGLATEVEQVAHRRHRHRHRAHVQQYRYAPYYAHQPYAYRYYVVPRYAYRPFYYSTWSSPGFGVYLEPRVSYYGRHRHW